MYKHLTSEQRYYIEVSLHNGISQKDIAKNINVSESTVSREIKRNKNKQGKYSSRIAQELSMERAERMSGNRAIHHEVKKKAELLLREEQWSPKQISGYLSLQGCNISHETIYAIIRQDKATGGDLYKNCRHKLKHRKRPVGMVSKIPNRVSIHERPESANATNFGHWEMDTIVGPNNSGAIVTLVERSTNHLIMKKLDLGKDAKALAKTVVKLLLPYKKHVKTITTDNGSEFTEHEYITKKIGGVKIYFADPYASWQKGAIENANKLIRQYIPKKTNIWNLSDSYILDIQKKINRRPREKLAFSSPCREFFKHFSKIALAS